MRSLNDIPEGKIGTVKTLLTKGGMRRRLQDIGLIEGTKVKCVQKSPLGDPTAFLIRGGVIALRSEDSQKVIIEEN